MTQKKISATVIKLSMVSLFTDMASEMLYPIMPIYLGTIGFSIIGIGVLEGFAEAIAGLSKGYFGKWSDRIGKRLPFVRTGYSLSALSKPMLAAFINPWWVFGVRSIDRIGKGIRTGARDAMLSDEATPATKGTVFGFHRSMDTVGAMLGPSLALVVLYYYPGDYKRLFYLAFIPGVLAVLACFILREKKHAPRPAAKAYSFFNFFGYWKAANLQYKQLTGALLVFGLVNSSDVFLLLKMKDAGVSDTMVIGVYIFYNAVFALMALPFGMLADKIGFKKLLLSGLIIFSLVYAGIGVANSLWEFIVIFLLYGVYAAATEGISKAWISNIVSKNETATAIGTFAGFQNIAALVASSTAGLIWYKAGATTLFVAVGVVTLLVVLFIALKLKEPVAHNDVKGISST
jgi:MFS family permease